MAAPKNKSYIFESMSVPKALLIMALPTVLSQVIILAYNLADTWFIGRANNADMIAAVSIVLALYLMLVAIANLFGVGGGSLMVRLLGIGDTEEAKKVSSYSLALAGIVTIGFSLLVLCLMDPLLRLLKADDNSIGYAREYLICTVVIGGLPTVMSMVMPMIIRNAGYSKEAGIGVALGGLLNIGLDPLFMFVFLPDGKQVLGAGLATLISSLVSVGFFIFIYIRIRGKSVVSFPKRIEKLRKTSIKSFYSVGIPAALIMILFNVLGVVLNLLTANYGNVALAASGIVLKAERLPQNIALGVCLGMVPTVAYNYARKDYKRMDRFFIASGVAILIISLLSAIFFYIFAEPIVRAFLNDDETVSIGAKLLRSRSISIPFMAFGFLVINFMQAVNHGKVSLLLSIIRHVILSIPAMLIFNYALHLEGLAWSQTIADGINSVCCVVIFIVVRKKIVSAPTVAPPQIEKEAPAMEAPQDEDVN